MFVHLHVHGPFSFLDGASSADALAGRAAELGQTALALTDHDGLSGAVSFVGACRRAGVRPILGAEVTVAAVPGAGAAGERSGAAEGRSGAAGGRSRAAGEGPVSGGPPGRAAGGPPAHLTLLAPDASGYRHLCRLLSRGHLEAPRGRPCIPADALCEHAPHLIGLSGCRRGEVPRLLLAGRREEARVAARRLARWFGPGRFALESPALRLPGDRPLLRALRDLGEHLGLPRVATCAAHHARRDDLWLHDLLCCARSRTRLDELGPERPFNGWGFLQSEAEVRQALADDPGAVDAAAELAERCGQALPGPGEIGFPRFPLPAGVPEARVWLRRQVEAGAARRYGPRRLPADLRGRIDEELAVIAACGFTDYMLVVAEIAGWARSQGIRTSGRGSAADSVVAYCLGLTDVDAWARRLPFARFLSPGRTEPPDVDLDFDAGRREDVAAHVGERYGGDHVAAVANYVTLQARSAVRTLGGALGLPEAEMDAVARRIPYYADAARLGAALADVPELRDLGVPRERVEVLVRAAAALAGFPRHLGTHLGGLVLTGCPIAEAMPLQMAAKGCVVGQYDKRDVEALGLVKIDLLHLRTLSAVDDAVAATGLDWDRIPSDDGATFRRLRRGDTVGAFQLESAAQRALHVQLGASTLEDVIASVALIRPGPIQGDMVRPFVERRRGREAVSYPAPGLEEVLGRTYGVVVYQEQVLELAARIAGFSDAEADRLRRTMSHARSRDEMAGIGRLFVDRAAERGTPRAAAEAIFETLEGYASYGFAEGHAAAFGLTGYRTLYLLEHHPAEWYAALLSHQPMGYYPAGTLINEARRRGIAVRPPDVERSAPPWTVEDGALRCGLCQVRGLRAREVESLLAGRPYTDLADLAARGGLARDSLRRLVLAGACDGLQPNRRAGLWEVDGAAPPAGLADLAPVRRYLAQAEALGAALDPHPLAILRPRLEREGVLRCDQTRSAPHGLRVTVAGLSIRPHRPPTRSGRRLVFLSLEDETGLCDVLIPEEVYRRDGTAIFGSDSPLLVVDGVVKRRGSGASLAAERVRAVRGPGWIW